MANVDKSLTLLQALIDENATTIQDLCINQKQTTKQWIDCKIKFCKIKHTRATLPDDYEHTCLGYGSQFNDVRTVRLLLQAGADITVAGAHKNTPLHFACASSVDAKEKVECLSEYDVSSLVNQHNIYNNAPLHLVTLAGNHDVISVLIQNGALVNARRGPCGGTALHAACYAGHTVCIHELMKYGADCDAKTSYDGATPLHAAAVMNQALCVATLVEVFNASTNACDTCGNTPLHVAAHAGNTDIVELLTSCPECIVKQRNNDGMTAVDIARAEGHVMTADFLLWIAKRKDRLNPERSETSAKTSTGSISRRAGLIM